MGNFMLCSPWDIPSDIRASTRRDFDVIKRDINGKNPSHRDKNRTNTPFYRARRCRDLIDHHYAGRVALDVLLDKAGQENAVVIVSVARVVRDQRVIVSPYIEIEAWRTEPFSSEWSCSSSIGSLAFDRLGKCVIGILDPKRNVMDAVAVLLDVLRAGIIGDVARRYKIDIRLPHQVTRHLAIARLNPIYPARETRTPCDNKTPPAWHSQRKTQRDVSFLSPNRFC